jgi:hypothetical protein
MSVVKCVAACSKVCSRMLKALASNDFVIGTQYAGDGFEVDKSFV